MMFSKGVLDNACIYMQACSLHNDISMANSSGVIIFINVTKLLVLIYKLV